LSPLKKPLALRELLMLQRSTVSPFARRDRG
jgi:hypothetical protein